MREVQATAPRPSVASAAVRLNEEVCEAWGRSYPRARSSDGDQTALPLVDQNVGDERGALGHIMAAHQGIARRQFLELELSLRGRQQDSQFLLPLPQGLLRRHWSLRSDCLKKRCPLRNARKGHRRERASRRRQYDRRPPP